MSTDVSPEAIETLKNLAQSHQMSVSELVEAVAEFLRAEPLETYLNPEELAVLRASLLEDEADENQEEYTSEEVRTMISDYFKGIKKLPAEFDPNIPQPYDWEF